MFCYSLFGYSSLIVKSPSKKSLFAAIFRQYYCNRINIDASKSSILCFTGNGDVQAFLTKVEIHAALKGYTGEELAQALASKLEGPAFDVYLRLSADDRKDPEKFRQQHQITPKQNINKMN